jgi:hypothetical protein
MLLPHQQLSPPPPPPPRFDSGPRLGHVQEIAKCRLCPLRREQSRVRTFVDEDEIQYVVTEINKRRTEAEEQAEAEQSEVREPDVGWAVDHLKETGVMAEFDTVTTCGHPRSGGRSTDVDELLPVWCPLHSEPLHLCVEGQDRADRLGGTDG